MRPRSTLWSTRAPCRSTSPCPAWTNSPCATGCGSPITRAIIPCSLIRVSNAGLSKPVTYHSPNCNCRALCLSWTQPQSSVTAAHYPISEGRAFNNLNLLGFSCLIVVVQPPHVIHIIAAAALLGVWRLSLQFSPQQSTLSALHYFVNMNCGKLDQK